MINRCLNETFRHQTFNSLEMVRNLPMTAAVVTTRASPDMGPKKPALSQMLTLLRWQSLRPQPIVGVEKVKVEEPHICPQVKTEIETVLGILVRRIWRGTIECMVQYVLNYGLGRCTEITIGSSRIHPIQKADQKTQLLNDACLGYAGDGPHMQGRVQKL